MAIATTPTVVIPADHIPGPPLGAWTDTDYLHPPDDGQHYELIDGVLYIKPYTGTIHQLANNLCQTYLTMYIEMKGLGRIFGPLTDVMLGPTTTVQPDVSVVLQANVDRITPRGILGPPDLVVEIASPSTATHDRGRKLAAYEAAGVPEYWLVDPFAHTVEVLVLTGGRYRTRGLFQGGQTLPSTVVTELPVRVEQFFA